MPVVFKKGYNGSIPPKLKQERKEQQRKQNQHHQQHQQQHQQQYQPNPSIQDLALATPLTKVFLDVNKRQEMGLLPRLHRGNLYKMFQQYAKRDGVGLNSQELFQWMVDGKKEQKNDQKEEQQEGAWMAPIDAAGGGGSGGGGGGGAAAATTDAADAESNEQSEQVITIELVARIIQAHDDNGDGVLQWSEFLPWISEGARLTKMDRQMLSKRSFIFQETVLFMEHVVVSAR